MCLEYSVEEWGLGGLNTQQKCPQRHNGRATDTGIRAAHRLLQVCRSEGCLIDRFPVGDGEMWPGGFAFPRARCLEPVLAIGAADVREGGVRRGGDERCCPRTDIHTITCSGSSVSWVWVPLM